jgi:hypothetical protein
MPRDHSKRWEETICNQDETAQNIFPRITLKGNNIWWNKETVLIARACKLPVEQSSKLSKWSTFRTQIRITLNSSVLQKLAIN